MNFLCARHATQVAEPLLVEGGSVCAISSGAGMGWMMHLPQILELVATSGVDDGRRWCEANPELVDQGYAFSKEVIIVWTMAASVRTRIKARIRLNCISPGPTDTPMMPQFIANSGKEFFDALPRPLGRNSTPEEQGHVMVFLNSGAASYVTGSNLFTDGAFSAGLYTGASSSWPHRRDPKPDRPDTRGGPAVEPKQMETIIYEKDGAVARIVMNTPEKANIQTAQQVWDFEDCLTWADRDDEVKVLIVKANGKGFCAGHAIVEPEEMAKVYPTTGPTFERTWKAHNYDLFLWPPLPPVRNSRRRRSPRSTGIASGAAPCTASSPT